MTTTTLTVPLTLFLTQVKVLRALVLSLALGGIFFWLSSSLPVALPLGAIVYSVLVVFSGPFLFGSEYTQGATDFLATRPVSARMVFSVKVFVLFTFWIIASVMFMAIFPREVNFREGFLVFAPFLSATLWCAAMSILTRDIVRGILYGCVGFALIAWLWYDLSDQLFKPTLTILDGELGGPGTRFMSETFLFFLSGIIMSPLLFLAILSLCHHYRRIGAWRLTWCGGFGFAVIGGYFFVCQSIVSTEGKTAVEASWFNSAVVATHLDEDRLSWVETDQTKDFRPYREDINQATDVFLTLRILSLELKRKDALPEIHASFRIRTIWGYSVEPIVFLTSDRLFLFGGGLNSSKLYSWNVKSKGLGSEHELILERELDPEEALMVPSLENEYELVYYWREKIEKLPQDKSIKIDLRDGSVEEIEPRIGIPEPEEVVRLEKEGFEVEGLFGSQSKVIDRRGKDPKPHILLPRFQFSALDGKYLAAVDEMVLLEGEDLDRARKSSLGGRDSFKVLPGIHIFDLKDAGNPIEIPLPVQVDRYNFLLEKSKWMFGGDIESPSPGLAFGGGYLSLWFQSPSLVAVWDVSDPMSPIYIGAAPFSSLISSPNNTSTSSIGRNWFHIEPIIRDDGALGYLSRNGVFLWLEFPALMKEEEQS